MRKIYILRRIKYSLGMYKKPSRASRFVTVLIIASVTLFLLFGAVECRLAEPAIELGFSQLSNDVLAESNKITSRITDEQNLSYDSIVYQAKDSSGRISSLTVDFSAVNRLKSDIAVGLADYLNSNFKKTCWVPAGSLISGRLMPASGITIPTSFICTSTAAVEFADDFSSAGINQTRHRLMIKITVKAKLRSAFEQREETILCEIPVAETVISGDVPGIALGSEFKTAPSDN